MGEYLSMEGSSRLGFFQTPIKQQMKTRDRILDCHPPHLLSSLMSFPWLTFSSNDFGGSIGTRLVDPLSSFRISSSRLRISSNVGLVRLSNGGIRTHDLRLRCSRTVTNQGPEFSGGQGYEDIRIRIRIHTPVLILGVPAALSKVPGKTAIEEKCQ